MTAESISKLLEVGHSLYQLQEQLKKVFGPYCAYLEEEIDGILRVIMAYEGIEEMDAINGPFKKKFLGLCTGMTSKEELLCELSSLKRKSGHYQKNLGSQVEMVNKLIEVVTVMNHKRGLIKSIFRGENYFLNEEKEILRDIVLQELGDRRAF
jgi:hypothetical protein